MIQEVEEMTEKIERSGLYQETVDEALNKEIREFFKNI